MYASTREHPHRTRLILWLLVAALILLLVPRAASAQATTRNNGVSLEQLEEEYKQLTPSTVPRTTGKAIDALPPKRRPGHWTIGIGPFFGNQLGTETAMYNFAAGYILDINPRASVKTIGETNFSSGAENARFLNLAVGANFFLGEQDTSPYLTTDIGYGFARNAQSETAEGFSAGIGAGFHFFKTAETNLDLLLRYAVVFDDFADGTTNPSVTGVRLAVNF